MAKADLPNAGTPVIVDDLRALHCSAEPLVLIQQYYSELSWDGKAWIRFPKSFWVFMEDGHRVSLQEYIAMKFPLIAKKALTIDMDPQFIKQASSTDDWLLLKKDRKIEELIFHLKLRSSGVTTDAKTGVHGPYLEFLECAVPLVKPQPKKVA